MAAGPRNLCTRVLCMAIAILAAMPFGCVAAPPLTLLDPDADRGARPAEPLSFDRALPPTVALWSQVIPTPERVFYTCRTAPHTWYGDTLGTPYPGWRQDQGNGLESAFSDGMDLFLLDTATGKLSVVGRKDGAVRVVRQLPLGLRRPLAASPERVLAFTEPSARDGKPGQDATLCCFQLGEPTKLLWRLQGVHAVLCVAEDVVCVSLRFDGADQGQYAAAGISLADGNILWQVGRCAEADAISGMANDARVCLSMGASLFVLRGTTGAVIGSVPRAARTVRIAAFCFTAPSEILYAVDRGADGPALARWDLAAKTQAWFCDLPFVPTGVRAGTALIAVWNREKVALFDRHSARALAADPRNSLVVGLAESEVELTEVVPIPGSASLLLARTAGGGHAGDVMELNLDDGKWRRVAGVLWTGTYR